MARTDLRKFYEEHYEAHGVSAQGVAWESAHTQRRRFAVIASFLGDLTGRSLVDAGCGFGDFYLYLRERGNLPASYVGLDLCPSMVNEARKRTGCRIERRDILRQRLPEADWYVASGSMNLLTRTETGIFIRRCFEKSARGFVFNLLEGPQREGELGYWRAHEILRLCRPLSSKIEIKEGYLEGDMTILLGA